VFALALHSIVPNDTQESVLKSTSPSDPNTNPHAAVLTTNALNLNLLKSLAARAALETSVGARHIGVVIALPPTTCIDAFVDHARRPTHRNPPPIVVVIHPYRPLLLKHHIRTVSLCVTETAAFPLDDDDDDDATAVETKDPTARRIVPGRVRPSLSRREKWSFGSFKQPKSITRLN
jgi:hypothetical protein